MDHETSKKNSIFRLPNAKEKEYLFLTKLEIFLDGKL